MVILEDIQETLELSEEILNRGRNLYEESYALRRRLEELFDRMPDNRRIPDTLRISDEQLRATERLVEQLGQQHKEIFALLDVLTPPRIE